MLNARTKRTCTCTHLVHKSKSGGINGLHVLYKKVSQKRMKDLSLQEYNYRTSIVYTTCTC